MMARMPLMEFMLLPCCPWSLISVAWSSENCLQDCLATNFVCKTSTLAVQMSLHKSTLAMTDVACLSILFWESGKKNFGLLMDSCINSQKKSLFPDEVTVLISLLEEPPVPALNKAVEEAFIVTKCCCT